MNLSYICYVLKVSYICSTFMITKKFLIKIYTTGSCCQYGHTFLNVLCFIALHKCCVFYKVGPHTKKKTVTCFIVILLLYCSGLEQNLQYLQRKVVQSNIKNAKDLQSYPHLDDELDQFQTIKLGDLMK